MKVVQRFGKPILDEIIEILYNDVFYVEDFEWNSMKSFIKKCFYNVGIDPWLEATDE
jgi:hypothetical protein